MVLLHAMDALAKKRNWKLGVAHLNHRLRGRSSDADEILVSKTAKKLKWPLFVERLARGQLRQAANSSLEMAAREARHGFLARTALAFDSRKIALAHHANDQVELFFLRALRGSGSQGLAGMRKLSPLPGHRELMLARPLLALEKSELERYARLNGVEFRVDASNRRLDIPRNRIRHELLPLLARSYQSAIVPVIARVMSLVQADADAIQDLALKWLAANHGPDKQGHRCSSLELPDFEKLPLGLKRRVVLEQLIALNISPDFDLIENLVSHPNCAISVKWTEVAGGSGSVQRVYRADGGLLHKVKSQAQARLSAPVQTELAPGAGVIRFDGVIIRWKILNCNRKDVFRVLKKESRQVEYFDAAKVGKSLYIRHWQAGDRYQPIGLRGHKKLQDCFTDLKLARDLRQKLLVATCSKGDIFWVEQLRIGDDFKVTERTNSLLEWCWERD